MSSDYPITAADRVMVFCPTCATKQPMFVERKDDGEQLTCCSVCGSILHRGPYFTRAKLEARRVAQEMRDEDGGAE